jgi:hypothetical protein
MYTREQRKIEDDQLQEGKEYMLEDRWTIGTISNVEMRCWARQAANEKEAIGQYG